MGGPMPPTAKPGKKPWWKSSVFIGVVALLIGFGLGSASRGNSSTASSQPTVTVTASAEPDPLDSGPVEGEPSTNTQNADSGKFAIGQPYKLKDGGSLTVGTPEPYKPTSTAAGTEGADAFVLFPVSFTNGGSEPVNPFLIRFQGTSGNSEAQKVIDSGGSCDFPTADIAPGKTLDWKVCFGIKPGQTFTLQWSYGFTEKGYVDVVLPQTS